MTQAERSELKLLVVDDESDNLDLLYRTFRREFKVFKADSGMNALKLLAQEGEMAIIISDQRMPGMNGTEFLRKTADEFPDTIRILLTGYTDVEDLVEAINAGKVFKYITKPWSPEKLKMVVAQAADTYRILKQRTDELHRALRRESIFNVVTTAIRESLDYRSMLQTIVETLGQTFAADACMLNPVEKARSSPSGPYRFEGEPFSFMNASLKNASGSTAVSTAPPGESGLVRALSSNPISPDAAVHLTPGEGDRPTQLVIPLTYQQDLLAILTLLRNSSAPVWPPEEVQIITEVAEQAALAISQARLYQRIQEQTEQMRAELAVARQIQSNLLRQELPVLEDVRIQACCHPAREVGGDFFEVYVHPQGDLWIGVGDVSGKGVPAALFMASAISVLRRELSQETSPEPNQVMQNLNSSLSDDLVSSNCFITLALARYTPATGELVYANAGHLYPLVWNQKLHDAEPDYLKVRGVPLGILPVWKAEAGRLKLHTGDVFLLSSDGITEATIPQDAQPVGAMLRQNGLWQLLKQQPGRLDLDTAIAHIQAHNPVQEDDQTLLALEVL